MAVQFRGSANQVVDEMIKAVDEYRNNAAPFGRGRDRTQRQEYNQKLEGYRERLAGLDRSAVETLEGLLGPDLSQSVKIAAADTTFEDETVRARPAGTAAEAGRVSKRRPMPSSPGSGPDPFLPSPITSRDVALYTKASEARRQRPVHPEVAAPGVRRRLRPAQANGYRGAAGRPWRRRGRPVRSSARKARRRGDENVRPTGPTPQQVDEIYDLRGSALKSIQALDGILLR